jgi:4,5-dihydroxyphthalate decarboxylase
MTTAHRTIKLGIVARSQYAALKEGIVKLQGATLEIVEVSPMPKLFDRMIQDLEFDISEMAIVTYLQLKELGQAFTAIPIFPMRAFPQGAVTYNVNSGVAMPKDLEGKKIGVRAYAGTAGVWARGLLASEYGVDHTKVTWVLTDIEHLDEIPNPSNTVSRKGDKLPDLITSGEIDAGIGVQDVNSPDVKPLIANAKQATADWFAKTSVFPINNCIVMRDEVLAANPDIAESFFAAYKQSKSLYLQRLAAQGPQARDEEADKRNADIVGGDPLPIGIESNRKALEMIAEYSLDQGVISAIPSIDDLFAPSTHGLS